MLRKFSVSNFKGFRNELVLDLSETNSYEFNSSCIKNGIVNSALIYGYNGVGKSNLGLAIFDIIEHLTDKNRDESRYHYYLNAFNKDLSFAEFKYEFLINNHIVKYDYKKSDYKTLLYEKLTIDEEEIILFDRQNVNQFSVTLKGTETLNKSISDRHLSAIKYIRNNTVFEENEINSTFNEFYSFIEKMLLFRSLDDRIYLGNDVGSRTLTDFIIENECVGDFQEFLNDAKVNCKLDVVEDLDSKTLAFNFDGKYIPINEIYSTGTSSLMLFYYWFQRIIKSKVSILFIDEFDAFYHHELSALIVRKLLSADIQFILTTHNTSIITNDLLRPDCYFLMNSERIQSLSRCTSKELREAHNLEKLYRAGTFNVK